MAFEVVKQERGHENLGLPNDRRSKLWPSMVTGRNVRLNVHDDGGFVLWVVVIAKEGAKEGLSEEPVCHFASQPWAWQSR